MTYAIALIIVIGLIWLFRYNRKSKEKDLWSIKDNDDYIMVDNQKLIKAMRKRDE
jgi:hypothetical protein